VSFWEALPLSGPAVAAGVVAGGLCGFLGIYVVLRRVVFVSAALSQVSTLGLAVALLYLGDAHGLEAEHGGVLPLLVSAAFSLAAAAIFAWRPGDRRFSAESIVGIGYAGAAAAAVLVIDRITAGAHDVTQILFGNAVPVPPTILWLLVGVAAAEVALHWLWFRPIALVAFEPESAQAAGYHARAWDLVLLLSFAAAIAFSLRAVGALPVFAFMLIPASAALLVTDHLAVALGLAGFIGAASAFLGFWASFEAHTPTGATVILASAAWLLPAGVIAAFRR
jgi:zinc transport system permease protein